MSQSHHGSSEESSGAHAIKMTIAVTIGSVALIVCIFMLAYFAVSTYTLGKSAGNANTPEAIAKRIAPVATIEIDASKASAPALLPVATASKVPPAPVVAVAIPSAAVAGAPIAAGGEGVYKNACVACHGAGIAGAPKTGDKGAWTARIAQGKPKLYEHAILGYQGKGGVMPAKGGNAALADADVKAAVDYMVASVK